jgi:uncharacterized protein YidB (DUF937 family)
MLSAGQAIFRRGSMGLLDGVLGGVIGASMVSIVSGIIEQHGGLQGVVAQLEKQGLGAAAQSWIGHGANQPISTAQVQQAFGTEKLQQLATQYGLSVPELSQKLAQVLPQAIDKLTPNGAVPKS